MLLQRTRAYPAPTRCLKVTYSNTSRGSNSLFWFLLAPGMRQPVHVTLHASAANTLIHRNWVFFKSLYAQVYLLYVYLFILDILFIYILNVIYIIILKISTLYGFALVCKLILEYRYLNSFHFVLLEGPLSISNVCLGLYVPTSSDNP